MIIGYRRLYQYYPILNRDIIGFNETLTLEWNVNAIIFGIYLEVRLVISPPCLRGVFGFLEMGILIYILYGNK